MIFLKKGQDELFCCIGAVYYEDTSFRGYLGNFLCDAKGKLVLGEEFLPLL